MDHAVAIYPIVLCHGTGTCGKRLAQVGLLMQDVVHLKADSCCFLKEILGELQVPDDFIPIDAFVLVSTATLVDDIAGERHIPWQVERHIAPIRK